MPDDLSLEQRLVLQLSAAMNHEEEAAHREDTHNANHNNNDHRGTTLGANSVQQQFLNNASELSASQLLSSLQSQLSSDNPVNLTELNNLVSSIGMNSNYSNGTIDTSALPTSLQLPNQPTLFANNNTQLPLINAELEAQLANLPLSQAALQQQLQPSQQHPDTVINSHPTSTPIGQNRANSNNALRGHTLNNEQNISTDALISSLLWPNSSGINLSNINLNNINLKEISLDTLTFISNTLGSNAAKQATTLGNVGQRALNQLSEQLPETPNPPNHIINAPQVPQMRGRTQSFIDQIKLSNEIQAALSDARLQALPSVPKPTKTSAQQKKEFNSTSSRTEGIAGIDPDVSTIQSVLQSLFGASQESAQEDAYKTSPENSSKPGKLHNSGDGGLDISSLGLGTEDQTLIDSLKSVFDGSAQSALTEYPEASSTLTRSLGSLPSQSHESDLPRSKRPRISSITGSSYGDTSKYKYQSDYTAADPDTLRAIQQALLGALNSSASSGDASSPSDRDSDESFRRGVSTPHTRGTKVTTGSTPGTLEKHGFGESHEISGLSSIRSDLNRSTSISDLSKSENQRLLDTKRKIREDNAARKRRWREVNVLQHRDNDLRARIIKRASEIFGQGESPSKSKWVDEEFERRRQRRILRAGINSIVESARARQASQETSGVSTAEYSSPYGLQGTQQGTLTQQSKQVASSQLSRLFKSSNAALEQHIYGGKHSIPIVPYMLVPFPKRPTFKVPNVHSTNKLSCQNVTSKLPSKSTDQDHETIEGAANSGTGTINANKSTSNPSTATAADQPQDESDKDSKDETSKTNITDTLKKHETTSPETRPIDSGVKTPEYKEPQDYSSSKKPLQEKANDVSSKPALPSDRYDETSERPKHRYSLVGKLRLGVPPNLTALYQKHKSNL